MARRTFRANLMASEFPLLSNLYGRTVVVSQNDMHYIRPNAFTGEQADRNIGIPQMIFCENVMPYSAGVQSIVYSTPIIGTANTDFDRGMYLIDAAEVRTLFVPANGQCRFFDIPSASWMSDPQIVPSGAQCTVANLKGRSFVCFSRATDFFEWNSATPGFDVLVLTGLSAANIDGIVPAVSYLVAWDKDTVYWSSAIDQTDFVPSLSTGAGSQKILDLKGPIVTCKQIANGFAIYSTVNVVYALYSGNISFPWVFKEVKGSSGLQNPEHAADESSGNNVYVWSTDGLMVMDRTKADPTHPTISEFLASRKIEVYNHTTKQIDIVNLTTAPQVKLCLIGNRWLCVSYGQSLPMTHCLVLDLALRRMGKLRIDHLDCFPFFGDPGNTSDNIAWDGLVGGWDAQTAAWSDYGTTIQSLDATSHPYQSIAFLAANGKVSVVDFSFTATSAVSVVWFGRFQFVRARNSTLLDVEVEGLATDAFLRIMTSYIGAKLGKVTGPADVDGFKKTISEPEQSKWQMGVTGINHTIEFTGNFQLDTLLLRTTDSGSR